MAANATLISLEDFLGADLVSPIVGSATLDLHALSSAYFRAANLAEERQDHQAMQIYSALAQLAGIHLNIEAGTFSPAIQLGDKRSAQPSDWPDEQYDVLAALAPTLANTALRARISDLAWTQDRRRGGCARDAVEAYCLAAEQLADGVFKPSYEGEGRASFEQFEFVQRALQISALSGRRGRISDRVKANLDRLLQEAEVEIQPVLFARIGGLMFANNLTDPRTLAERAEALSTKCEGQQSSYPLAEKGLMDLAASVYRKVGDGDALRRVGLAGVEQTLKMREPAASASVRAHWTRVAIAELQNVEGTAKRRAELRQEMRELQEESTEEYGTFQIPLNLRSLHRQTEKQFKNLSRSEALHELACAAMAQPKNRMEADALQSLQTFVFAQLMGSIHTDRDGKPIAATQAASMSRDPQPSVVKSTMSRNHHSARLVDVRGVIEPARSVLCRRFSFSTADFLPIVQSSPFVDPFQRMTYALGFTRMIEGDYLSAAHLLVPQVENSVRYVLRHSDTDTVRMHPEGIQEDRPMSGIFENNRKDLERVFGEDNVHVMDLVFLYKPGPALRHRFAHGLISSSECYSDDVIWACWFVYHLTCLPLLESWAQHIEPMIVGIRPPSPTGSSQ